MKCPECIENGEKSCVYPVSTTITSLGGSMYWDEDGELVVDDDPSTGYISYSCSNGHQWGEFALRGVVTIRQF